MLEAPIKLIMNVTGTSWALQSIINLCLLPKIIMLDQKNKVACSKLTQCIDSYS